jgi:uncharacterized protein YegP (UPF0339 family)
MIASNGQMIANSGRGYNSKDNARRGVESAKSNGAIASIEDKS